VLKSVVRKLILLLVAAATSVALLGAASASAKSYTTKGAWSFVSAPGLHPPKLRTDGKVSRGKLAQGQFLLANFKDLVLSGPMVGQGGPLIVNSQLQPVWFNPVVLKVSKQGQNEVGANSTLNLHEQSYNGQPVLSWWQGTITNTGDTLSGEDIVVDQHYRTVATLSAPKTPTCGEPTPWVITEHEFVIQGQNAWVTAYASVPMDLTKYGGPAKGTVIDSAVQEYNLKTGQLEYCFDALKNLPLSDSYSKPLPNGVWDAYHENSISLGSGNTFLVSMRNDWAGYDVSYDASNGTSKVLWALGGKHSTFSVPSNARFQWQHDIELHPGNVVSVFDDHCCNVIGPGKLASPTGPSRGLVLKLNLSKHTATRMGVYGHGNSFFSAFLGNTDLLKNGNVAVGWGTQPFFTEYSKGGSRLLDAVIPNPDLSYRTYVQSWVGLPLTTPSGAVRTSHGKSTVYTSWNGATRVVAWRVLAGSSKTSLKTVVSHTSRTGFETAIPVPGSHKVYEVEALSKSGSVLSTSKPFGSSSPALVGGY
jgi:hypothetical protein